jgi:hypothetical protein
MTRRTHDEVEADVLALLGSVKQWLTANAIAGMLGAANEGVKRAADMMAASGIIEARDVSTLRDQRIVYASKATAKAVPSPQPQTRAAIVDQAIIDVLADKKRWLDASEIRRFLPEAALVEQEYLRARLYVLADAGLVGMVEPKAGQCPYRRYAPVGTPPPEGRSEPRTRATRETPPAPVPKRLTPWAVIASVLDEHEAGRAVRHTEALLARNLASQHVEAAWTREQKAVLKRWGEHEAKIMERAAR